MESGEARIVLLTFNDQFVGFLLLRGSMRLAIWWPLERNSLLFQRNLLFKANRNPRVLFS